MRRDVFQAIADPNRREILAVLARQTLTLNGVAEQFHISRPAVSKHIKILSECGLVVTTQHGRERYCEVRLDKLAEVSSWVEEYRELWSQRFDALDEYLTTIQSSKKRIAKVRREPVLLTFGPLKAGRNKKDERTDGQTEKKKAQRKKVRN